MELRCLITGTGRCGTQYAAHLLNQAGEPCGHELRYGMRPDSHDDFPAESSWLAAPHIHRLHKNTKVIHLVRHPEKTVASFLKIRFFADSVDYHIEYWWNKQSPWREYAISMMPESFKSLDEVGRCVFFYWYWNKMIEDKAKDRDYTRVRLIDISENPLLLYSACNVVPPKVIDKSVIDDVYLARVKRPNFTFDSFPNGEIKERCLDLSRHYGYDV